MPKAPDVRLISLVDKYIQTAESDSSDNVLATLYKNLQNPEMLVPVLGLQGVGKSTLINGILKENVMPNEADETTCIPVEVRYGEKPSVWLSFPDGRKKEIASGDIYEYVDNNCNPGNEKNVSHIVIYRNIELLKTGIVLVDLPGVGSMTAANQETTSQYIKNLYSAIFVIRVVPPITRTEAIFIKIAWHSMSNAWFVQNRWNSENDREVEEGLDANKTILLDIAEKSKIPYNNEIITVNAYKALVGVLQNDPSSLNVSNIAAISDKLKMISANWKEKAEALYIERTLSFIDMIKSVINEEINKCGLTREELKAKLKKEEDAFDETTHKTREHVAQIGGLLRNQRTESVALIQNMVKEAKENIRANIYRVVDGGVTDGNDLTQAFKDYQVQEFGIVSDRYLDFVNEKILELSREMEELGKLFDREKNFSFTEEVFYKKQALKWEKGLNAAIKIGGAVGGFFALAKISTLIGTAVFPGFGTIIGAVAGILIGLTAYFIGRKTREKIVAERARDVKRQIAPMIDNLCEEMTGQLTNSFADICDNASTLLDGFLADRLTEASQIKEHNVKTLQAEHNTESLLQTLKDDLGYLAILEGQIRV